MPHLLRHSSYLILALAFVCSLLLGAEFDLIGFATGGHPRHQKLELGELLTLSGLFSLLLAGIAVVNGRLARHERRKRTEIECTANLDALTSIANRRLLFEWLEAACARSREGAACAVILLDLDGFKAINDAHGHAAGDRILIHVARQIESLKVRNSLAARLGGDEFALVVQGTAGLRSNRAGSHRPSQGGDRRTGELCRGDLHGRRERRRRIRVGRRPDAGGAPRSG